MTLVTMVAKDRRESEDLRVVKVFPESRCPTLGQNSAPSEKSVFQEETEGPESPENLVSLDYLDVQVRRVAPALWANWAGLDLLVFLELLVTPDPLDSQDPLENKVFPVKPVFPALPAPSVAATASASLW